MSSGTWSNGPRGQQGQSQVAQTDAEDFMNKIFADTVGNNVEAMTYKPSNTTSNAKGGGLANTRNGSMANGKDFFAELAKQVKSLADKEKAGG
ncbi:MAG: hypothetical protein MMC23_000972 [Stictis urceolatum]|nr:hypothetical protein [Stictis urceolata]